MATPSRTLKLQLVTDVGTIKKDVASVTRSFDAMRADIARRGGIKGALLKGFGIGAGIGAFNMLTDAVHGVVDAVGDAIQASADEKAGIDRLTTSLAANIHGWDGNTDAIEATIAAREKLAFSDSEQRDALALLVTRTHDVTEALDLERQAMDLARLRGMSLADASGIIGKVYSGNVGILKRYGIAVDAGASSTEALAQVQKASKGQAAAYGKTMKGQTEALNIALGDLQEDIGGLLAGPATDLVQWLAGTGVDTLRGALNTAADAWSDFNRLLNPEGAEWTDIEKEVRKQSTALGYNADAVVAVARATWDKQKADAAMVQAMEDVNKQADDLYNTLVANGMSFKDAADYISDYRMKLMAALAPQGDLTKGVDATGAVVADTNKYFVVATNAIQAWIDAGKPAPAVLTSIGNAAADLPPVITSAATAMSTFPDIISSIVTKGKVKVHSVLQAAKDQWAVDAAEIAWALKHPMTDARLAEFYKQKIDESERARRKAIREGNTTALAIIDKNIAKWKAKAAELADTIWRYRVEVTGHVKKPGERGYEYVAQNASGTSNAPGGWSWVGERGPELVNLRRGSTVLDAQQSMAAAGGGGGGNVYSISVNVAPGGDLAAAGRQMVRAIQEYEKRGGRNWRTA